MFYRVEAVRSFSGTQDYDPDGEIVMTTRSRRHGDVCRAIYYYLLAGYWVRIIDDDNQQVWGPFRPGAVLPAPFKAFAQSLDRGKHGKTTYGAPLQNQQADAQAAQAAQEHSSHLSL